MNPAKNKKNEPYAEPEIQDIQPVSVVRGGDGEGMGSNEDEGMD